MPSPRLRGLELQLNGAFDTYRELCVSSVHAFAELR